MGDTPPRGSTPTNGQKLPDLEESFVNLRMSETARETPMEAQATEPKNTSLLEDIIEQGKFLSIYNHTV